MGNYVRDNGVFMSDTPEGQAGVSAEVKAFADSFSAGDQMDDRIRRVERRAPI
jgi:hypothetical protein